MKTRFQKAGVAYPAAEIFLRAFKREGEAELWARSRDSEKFQLIHTFAVTQASGGPGPKRREGDGQVPEGFYQIERYNPKSLFHLSLGLNYPNESDRVLSDQKSPGKDIFIHGSNVSVGCLPLGDEAIEELYITAIDTRKKPIQVHIFPARMNAADWSEWRDKHANGVPGLAAFWAQLQPGFDLFEANRQLPIVRAEKDGRYTCGTAR